MNYLNTIAIEQYKGIKNLTIDGFSKFNLVTGPNGCGKTSLLEAMQILLKPTDFSHYVKVTGNKPSDLANSFYKADTRTHIAGTFLKQPYFTEIVSHIPITSGNFHGFHNYGVPVNGITKTVSREIQFSFLQSKPETQNPLLPYGTVSPDFTELSFRKIQEDSFVREKVISYLSLFDSDYEDFQSQDFHNTVITHKRFGALKSDFFSGGIRYVLKIAEQFAGLKNGILFLDPLEHCLACNSLEEIVHLLYSFCREKHVQLFAVTYSAEVIDEWLDLLHFYNSLSQLKIFRLKSHNAESTVQAFDGVTSYQRRIEREDDFRKEFS